MARLVFPAYAGVILMLLAQHNRQRSLSRIRGGDPILEETNSVCNESSRIRGGDPRSEVIPVSLVESFPHTRG